MAKRLPAKAKRIGHSDALLSVRTTVILLLTTLVGVSTAFLAHSSDRPVPEALLAGLLSCGGSLPLFNSVIGD